MPTRQLPLLTQFKLIMLRYRFIILSLIATAAGIVMIYYVNVTPYFGVLHSIAEDVGPALTTAGTIGLALEYYTRRQFQELVTDSMNAVLLSSTLNSKLDALRGLMALGKDLQVLGIRQIYTQRHQIDFMHHLAQADPGTEIRMLGVCMMSFTHAPMQVALKEKLMEGCKIKLLILDSASKFVEQRAIEEKRNYKDISSDIAAADKLHANFITHRLSAELQERIGLRHYDSAPAYFIFSTNKVMIIGFYLRDARGEFFPHLELEIQGGGIYAPFLQHFDSLWEASSQPAAGQMQDS